MSRFESSLEDFFTSHAWKLIRIEDGDEILIAPGIKFYKNGIVGGVLNKNERCWHFSGNKLCLQTISGVTTTEFEVTKNDDEGILELTGQFSLQRRVTHRLVRTTMPSLADKLEMAAPAQVKLNALNRQPSGRRNLVFIPAGPSSKHFSWPKYIRDEDRNWDICINWYGEKLPDDLGFGEYICHQPGIQKFSAIYNMISSNPYMMDYDNFWLPDDDLETSWKDINRIFNVFRRTGLTLAQPSISKSSDSFPNHEITITDPNYFVRFTNFVELMAPVFSNEMLRALLPVFNGTVGAYVMDHMWGGIEGRVPGRMGIIDDVAVGHSRPLGMAYKQGVQAMDEGREIGSLFFNINDRYDVIGGIKREHCFL